MAPVALVVDDSMLIRHTVCRFFEERGFTVESATNPLEALELLKHLRPDLIVTDLQMPQMSGSEFISILKQGAATQGIPIFVVSGRQSGSDDTEARADYCIHKDIDIEAQLGKALKATMGKRASGSAAGK
jgi:CheY-like chemotaxis protein